jgi:hypothetical protein
VQPVAGPALTSIHEAVRIAGPDGAVERSDDPISDADAVLRLQSGRDVVVCGPQRRANRNKARELTTAAFGGFEEDEAHQGRMALPHFHPPIRPSAQPHTRRNPRFLRVAAATGEEEKEEMKYFKPDLLARCRSLNDDEAETAAAEWEQAINAYRARLRAVGPKLPGSVRRLLSRFSLHDAKVLALAAESKKSWLNLVIQLEDAPSQAGAVLELGYQLVAEPLQGGVTVRRNEPVNKDVAEWILYDEFDVEKQGAVFRHTLLLTGGREVEVRFHKLRVRRLGEVLPQGSGEEKKSRYSSIAAT